MAYGGFRWRTGLWFRWRTGQPYAPPASEPCGGTDAVAPSPHRPGRRLLALAVAALLAAAIAAPVTWYVLTRPAGEVTPETPTATTREKLHQLLVTRLPDQDVPGRILLAPNEPVAFPPGRYRVDLLCGILDRPGRRALEMQVHVATPTDRFMIRLPCPSTPLSLPAPLDFSTAVAGAVTMHLVEEDLPAEVVAQLVPLGEGA